MSDHVPGNIMKESDNKVVFKTPFSDKSTYNITLTNASENRIGWSLSTTNQQRLNVSPPCGCLDAEEEVKLTISCEPFDHNTANTNNDRVSIEWTNMSKGGSKEFRREHLLQSDSMVRRKNLPIQYNA